MLSGDINKLARDVMSTLNTDSQDNKSRKIENKQESPVRITPSKALVIAGILSGTLEVFSVLIDRNQTVEIVLAGSLKEKTDLERMLDQIGTLPFDEVLKAIVGKFTI